jgi:hypothetical protein
MSEPYQIFVLIPDGIHAEKAVYDTHEILEKMGGVLDEDSMLERAFEKGGDETKNKYAELAQKLHDISH